MDSRQQTINVGLAGLGGVVAQFCTHPFETTMVRQQLSGSFRDGGSLLSMGARIVREEGFALLWRGFEAAAVREILYSSLRFGLYEPIKTALRADSVHYGGDPRQVPFVKKMAAGCLAGAFGSAIASPTDLVKTRMQRDTHLPPLPLSHHVRQVVAEPPGLPWNLYLGAGATIVRAAVLGGTKMAVYDQTKTHMKHSLGLSEQRSWAERVLVVQLGASVLTGLAVTATSSPFTNARTYIMSAEPGTFSGIGHCLAHIVRNKGPLGVLPGAHIKIRTGEGRKGGCLPGLGPRFHGLPCDTAGGGGFRDCVGIGGAEAQPTRWPPPTHHQASAHTRAPGCAPRLATVIRAWVPVCTGLYAGFGAQWARFGPYAIIQFIAWEKLRELFGMPPI